MGWFSFGIYGGDCTQTQHVDFIKAAGISKNEDEILSYLKRNRTIIPKDKKNLLSVNFNKIVKKLSSKIRNEDDAISWQMLASLFVNNKVKMPVVLKRKAIEATNYLIEHCCDDFVSPSRRRENLKRFLNRIS